MCVPFCVAKSSWKHEAGRGFTNSSVVCEHTEDLQRDQWSQYKVGDGALGEVWQKADCGVLWGFEPL